MIREGQRMSISEQLGQDTSDSPMVLFVCRVEAAIGRFYFENTHLKYV